jgi:acyl-CoA synthetase (NDP forming)
LIDSLFRPRSVAIVGASSDPSKTAGRPLRYLRKHGFAGALYPVNPNVAEIDGVRCYPRIADLPHAPDAAIVLVGADGAEQAVRDLAAIGTRAAVVLAGGYAEVGAQGMSRQRALRTAAGTMRLLGPNTVGLVNLVDRVTLAATSALEIDGLAPGRIALASQSGGMMGAVLSRAAYRGIALSRLAATGNEADLEIADFIEWFVDDPESDVIALYLEGLRDVGRFRAAAERAAGANKPLVIFKVGRSEAGARSTQSHTGALAGEDRLYDGLFAQVGAIRVATFSDLAEVAMALSARPRAMGKRLAVLTTTGGAGTLLADACGLEGFSCPPPGAATATKLAGLLSNEGFTATVNPIDLTLAGVRPEVLSGAIDALMADPAFDALATVVGSSGLAQPDLVAAPAIAAMDRASKPLLAYVSPAAPEIVRRLNAGGVPAFDRPEGLAAALSALGRRPPKTERRIVAPITSDLSGRLNEWDSTQLFAGHGIPAVRGAFARSPEEVGRRAAEYGPQVVVKLVSRALAHKSDVGAVRVGVPVAEVAAVCRAMGSRPHEGFLVQEQIADGIELILGFVRDPQLGSAIVLGGGGIAAEVRPDIVFRLLPISRIDAAAMVDALAVRPMLDGWRGRPAADVPALIDAVLAFADLCGGLGARLREAEINPLFVRPLGQGVAAGDGLVII